MNTPPSCHIFCTVIDNFGDIGVSWRLARILQNECRWRVTLWLDDEAALRALCPGLPALPCRYRDTDLRLWREGGDMPQWDETADIVIETFGCNLPEGVKKSIARQKALWLNWEYLSAEEWAAAMHGKPSPQADGTEKFFWLMGFDERGGGLLREKNYAELCREVPHLLRRAPRCSAEAASEPLQRLRHFMRDRAATDRRPAASSLLFHNIHPFKRAFPANAQSIVRAVCR